MILNTADPQRIVALSLLSTSKVSSSEGSSRIMLKSLRAGSVMDPGFSTPTSHEVRIPISKSVADIVSSLLSAFKRRLFKMPIGVRDPTTFWTADRALRNFCFWRMSFMKFGKSEDRDR